jgi:hypothetical protein
MTPNFSGTALAVLILAAAATSAAAADKAKPAPARQCFWPTEVNGFTPVDDTHVNLHVGVKDVYQVELLSPCLDIRWNESLGVKTRGASMVCTGLDIDIISPSSIGPQRCPARTLRKLTPEEVAALSAKKHD